jgi:TM2 domain-containing membrane protein YozV/ribosomal protein L37E
VGEIVVKVCSNCGSKDFPSDAQFCTKCGNELSEYLPQENKIICPKCGNVSTDKQSKFCPKCGTAFHSTNSTSGLNTLNSQNVITPKTANPLIDKKEEKSPFVAALCSFFIPGLGQVYNGETAKGLGIFFGTIIGFFIFLIPGFICWIYGIYDAYTIAKKMNTGQVTFKKTKTAHLIIFIILAIIIVAVVGLFIVAFAFTQYTNSNSATYSSSHSTLVTAAATQSVRSSAQTISPTQQSPVFTFSDVKLSTEGEMFKTTYLSGKIQNSGSTSPKTVLINVYFYDKDGVRIDDRSTYVSDLKPGETAVFKVLVTSQIASSITKWDLKAQGY